MCFVRDSFQHEVPLFKASLFVQDSVSHLSNSRTSNGDENMIAYRFSLSSMRSWPSGGRMWNCCRIPAKKRNSSWRAISSPRHYRFPVKL